MTKITLKLARLSADALITASREVRDKMTNNADLFPNMPVTTVNLNNAITELQAAQQATLQGGKPAFALRDDKRKILESYLRELANYIETVAKGDREIIYAAGMTPKAQGPRRYDSIDTPQHLVTESVISGMVKIRWKKIHNARAYMVEYCTDPITGSGWQTGAYGSGANAMIFNLEEGRKYWFRVRAIGSQGMLSNWSDPMAQRVS